MCISALIDDGQMQAVHSTRPADRVSVGKREPPEDNKLDQAEDAWIREMGKKTNAIRMLEAAQVDFEVCKYEIEEGGRLAERAAAELGVEPERIFKTLVVRGDRSGPLLAMVPAGTEIDLKRIAAVSGNRRVEMVPQKQVRELTGYPRGAVTPLGLRRTMPIYIDETVELWP
ncbi:MAG TPA: hypothetical protein ENL35_04240, partial [Chloroflexi bacterium]|nr:hypothetical protein [Chloroflexota bacterium]